MKDLTKREYFAAMAMLASKGKTFTGTPDEVAKWSVWMADALIRELSETDTVGQS